MADDPLLAERSFLGVVETGSLSAAARLLGTDVSTVSRRLAALEQRLGVKLMERGQRNSRPTAAGLRYFEGLRRLVDEQDALVADVRGEASTPSGLLRVSAPVNLGERHVARWLLEFQRQWPKVSIELLLDDRYVDLRATGVDLALRIGPLADSSLHARPLGRMALGLFASPDYLAARGRPSKPEQLREHMFVLFSYMQAGDRLRLNHADGRRAEVTMQSSFAVNNVGAIERVVAAGAGIHAGPWWLFGDAVLNGGLESVLPEWAPERAPVHAIHGFGRRVPAKVALLIEHLGQHVSALTRTDRSERA